MLEGGNQDLVNRLSRFLARKAQGMFSWIAYQLDHSARIFYNVGRLDALSELPPTLQVTYRRQLDNLACYEEKMQEVVCKVLHWAGLQYENFSAEALCVAVSVLDVDNPLSEDDIIDSTELYRACRGLISRHDDRFALSHFTVRDYLQRLESSAKPLGRFYLDCEAARMSLTEAAMLFLSKVYRGECTGLSSESERLGENGMQQFLLFSAKMILDSEQLSDTATRSKRILAPDIIREYARRICEVNKTVTDREIDIESVIPAVLSDASLNPSHSSAYHDIQILAISLLAHLFRHDEEMVTLYPQAISKLGSSQVQRTFTKLLENYSRNLEQETTNKLYIEAARFIRQYARRVANELTIMVQLGGYGRSGPQEGSGVISIETELGKWIDSHDWPKDTPESLPSSYENDRAVQIKDEEDNLSDSSGSTTASDGGNSSIGSLQDIQNFLVSSEAHSTLRRDFRQWLKLRVEENNDDDNVPVEENIPDTEYDISVSLQIAARTINMLKRTIERIVGCRLSWWPLTQPESDLNTGYTRVYSTSLGGRRFYDDISTPLAILLFPKLTKVHSFENDLWMEGWRREVVQLRGTTLAAVLVKKFGSAVATTAYPAPTHITPSAQPSPRNTPVVSNVRGQAPSQLISTANNNQSITGTITVPLSQTPVAKPDPLLYVSTDIKRNASRARPAGVGKDDQETLHNLRACYYSFASRWYGWKRPVGIKFYRFDSFLFQSSLDLHCISVHRDQERYPQQSDPEYPEYQYQPRPWPAGALYPNNEVWHYFENPGDCGTSTYLRDVLPVQTAGGIGSRKRAFGLHIEEAYSAWAIFIPAFVVVLATLAATLWFIPRWLRGHPDDLQNAAVPVTVVFTVVGSVLQILVSLVIFRWTLA
ncbi:hypothetical protein F4802DRAFT_180002 [Xylaria palmicola]|nr:hypothetical protein F4802DRAFT_180002 [Xylaria palmicola]